VERATRWLKLAGCRRVFPVSSYTREGIDALLDYLSEDEITENEE
jgi:ethanolamine utilization protein EutP